MHQVRFAILLFFFSISLGISQIHPVDDTHFGIFQKLDHFKSDNHKKLYQLFDCDSSEFNPRDGPAIVYLTITPLSQDESTPLPVNIKRIAKDLNGVVITLPIRFFVPFYDSNEFFSPENLEFLSIDQIIEDINCLILLIRSSEFQQIHAATPILLLGQHFLGSICLYARQKYPSNIQGCISSDPILNALEDFKQLSMNISNRIRSFDEPCLTAIRETNEYLEAFVGSSRMDSSSDRLSPETVGLLRSMKQGEVLEVFSFIIQRLIEEEKLQRICERILIIPNDGLIRRVSVILEEFSTVNGILMNKMATTPTGLAFPFIQEEFIKSNEGWRSSTRLWLWLQCTEFGMFATTPQHVDDSEESSSSSNQFASVYLSVEYFKEKCIRVFGDKAQLFGFERTNSEHNMNAKYITNTLILIHGNSVWASAMREVDLEQLEYNSMDKQTDIFSLEQEEIDSKTNAIRELITAQIREVMSQYADRP